MSKLTLLLVLLAAPAAAAEPTCPYGLVAVDASHCCWPGQTFAVDRDACAGTPQCPAGLVASGETCLVPAAPVQQPQPAAEPTAPPPAHEATAPPLPPEVLGHPVRFEARHEGQEFTVSVGGGVSCRTPCELTVPPGRHRVEVEGDASFRDDFTFPASPSLVLIERRSGGRAALGIVGLAVGIPATVVGLVVVLAGAIATDLATGPASREGARNMLIAGGVIAAAGVTFVAVGAGVGFGTAGKNRLRFARASGDRPGEEPPVRLVGLGAAPAEGGAMLGATLAF